MNTATEKVASLIFGWVSRGEAFIRQGDSKMAFGLSPGIRTLISQIPDELGLLIYPKGH